jgi:D-alanyl-D-alanine carboxypeptidase/D-alanyl-D-alanine-endopeptidase (penicillin-binding protein 4)
MDLLAYVYRQVMRSLPALLLLTLLPASAVPPQAVGRGPSDQPVETSPSESFGPAAATPAAAPAPTPAVLALRTDLERLIAGPRWPRARWGVMVLSLDQGDTLFAHAGDQLLTPASNMKLFTSAAALYYLGPQFRYNTFLLATGPIENGVLDGDLVLYGTGDPALSDRFGTRMTVWRGFADSLKALGISEVRGAVVGDGSYFGGSGTGAGWKEDYVNAAYAAPAGALSYAENIATLEIRPARAAGRPPEVRLVPGGDGVLIVNEAMTVASGRSWINVSRAAYDGPITVRGRIRRGTGSMLRSLPVSDPARYAAAVLREVLEDNGIAVLGGVRSVQAESESSVTGRSVFAPAFDARPLRVLALHNSPPLIDILEVVNKRSHNLMAEQALRTVARVATGSGTVEGGARAISHLLAEAAPEVEPAIAVYDGSGLSPLNQVSARTTIHLLSYMARSPMWESYWQTLPEAGGPGGLRRMYRTGAERNLRAKTGTIDNVSALSGYVRAANGERLAFAILANEVPSTSQAKRIEDAIGARLAAFDRHGPAVTSAPEPRRAAKQPAARSYTIRKGDTFSGIAQRNGTSVAALRRANPGIAANRLIPGRKIKLP